MPVSRSQISKLGALLLNLEEELVLIIVTNEMLPISPLPRPGPRISLLTSKGFFVTLYCSFGMGQATLVVIGCVLQWNSEVADKYTVLIEEF